jgi:hypothetical protein
MNSATEFRNLLTCEYCNKVFEKPVILPCGESMCEKDVKGLFAKENDVDILTCFFCMENHIHPEEGFPRNKILNRLLRHNLQNLQLGHKYEQAKHTLDKLKHKLSEIDSIRASPAIYLNQYFNTIINQMDVKKEYAKIITDSIYEKMFKEVHQLKGECEKELEKKGQIKILERIQSNLVDDAKLKLEEWYSKLSELVVDENKWFEIYLEAEMIEKELEKELIDLKRELLLNRCIEFKPVQLSLDSNIFGEVKISVSIFFC